MAADLAQKKSAFIRRYYAAIDSFINQVNDLQGLKAEWDAMAYATGAQPPENNITDADCTATAPWIDALILNEAIGAQVAVGNEVDSQRGYLEAVRP